MRSRRSSSNSTTASACCAVHFILSVLTRAAANVNIAPIPRPIRPLPAPPDRARCLVRQRRNTFAPPGRLAGADPGRRTRAQARACGVPCGGTRLSGSTTKPRAGTRITPEHLGICRTRYRHGVAPPPLPARLGCPDLAARAWRHRLETGTALDFRDRMRGGRRPGPVAPGPAHGRPGHHALRHARAKSALPAAHAGRRRLLVPGLFRAGLGLRSGIACHSRGARRRPLCDQRQQDLDHPRAFRQSHVRPGAQRRGHAQEARGHQLSPDRHGRAGHHGAADPRCLRRPRSQSGVLRRRAGAGRLPAGR